MTLFFINNVFSQSSFPILDKLESKKYLATLNKDSSINNLINNLYADNEVYMIDSCREGVNCKTVNDLLNPKNNTLCALISKIDSNYYLILFNHNNFVDKQSIKPFIYSKKHQKVVGLAVNDLREIMLVKVLNTDFKLLAEFSYELVLSQLLQKGLHKYGGNHFTIHQKNEYWKCNIDLIMGDFLINKLDIFFDNIDVLLKLDWNCEKDEYFNPNKMWHKILR